MGDIGELGGGAIFLPHILQSLPCVAITTKVETPTARYKSRESWEDIPPSHTLTSHPKRPKSPQLRPPTKRRVKVIM